MQKKTPRKQNKKKEESNIKSKEEEVKWKFQFVYILKERRSSKEEIIFVPTPEHQDSYVLAHLQNFFNGIDIFKEGRFEEYKIGKLLKDCIDGKNGYLWSQ